MKQFVKLGMFAFLSVALTTNLAGCSDDDPDYSSVTPPTVAVSHSISGRVTGMDGKGLTATVSMNGTSVQTDADGVFLFEKVDAGSYTLKAEADGKQTKEETVTVSTNGNGANVVWNVVLPNAGTTIEINADGSAEASVTSETIEGNAQGAVTVDVAVAESTLPEGSSIVITPIYTMEEATGLSRATEEVMLIGTNVESANADATLEQPITLTYDVDPEMAEAVKAQKYENGKWIDAEYTVENGQVTVVADQFTSYSLTLNADVTSSSNTVALDFGQNSWDNLYGSGDMSVSSASFSYHIGMEITSSGTDRITAYLIEILARMAGVSTATATGNYPLDVTLPIGTALQISGTQQVTTLTVSALGHSASGKQYGNFAISAQTYNREHNGGTN